MSLRKPKGKFLPANTDFDHLHSEYVALAAEIEPPDKIKLDAITARRALPHSELSWDEIYEFELILLKYLSLRSLRNKVISLRDKFVNVFGQDKYRSYLETKLSDPNEAIPEPPQGTTDPAGWKTQKEAELVERLREDCKYLLGQIYQAFAALSARDGLGKWLTIWAAYLLLGVALLGAGLLLLAYGRSGAGALVRSPVGVVFFAGALGGLISVLQRLESIPTEGDPIYSLTTFWNGSYALFVSPLTGAIFGVVLYLVFAGTILQGKFFPAINTPQYSTDADAPCSTPTPTPIPTPMATPTPTATATPPAPINPARVPVSPTPTATATALAITASPSPTASPTPSPTPGVSLSPGSGAPTPTTATPAPTSSATVKGTPPPPSPTATPSSAPAPSGSTSFKRFLKCTGPTTGFDYALLIIWCFIAGFAERLVPDTLSRLVDENTKTTVKKS